VQRHVEPLGGDVDRPVREPQAQVDLREERLERGDLRRHEPPPHAQRRADEERAARVLRRLGDRRLGLVDRGEDLQRPLVEEPPVLGCLQPAGGAVEETHAQVLLQLGDPPRGDGGRGAPVARRCRHAAQLEDAHEHLQVGDIGHGDFQVTLEGPEDRTD
jgi:hypothetical protein